MKVYTEVNYEFKNGVLVEQSSKSYEYTGEVSLCKGGGGVANTMRKTLDESIGAGVDKLKDPAGTIAEGVGKGSLGQLGGKLYGGSFKQGMDALQGKTGDDGDVAAPELGAEEVDAQGALVAQQKKRKEGAGRSAANLTAGQTATMLTS